MAGVPVAKAGRFAGEARLTGAADMKKTGEAKRPALLAAMVHTLRVSARDEVTDMFCRRMAVIHRKGRERLAEPGEAHLAEEVVDELGPALDSAEPAADYPGELVQGAGGEVAQAVPGYANRPIRPPGGGAGGSMGGCES